MKDLGMFTVDRHLVSIPHIYPLDGYCPVLPNSPVAITRHSVDQYSSSCQLQPEVKSGGAAEKFKENCKPELDNFLYVLQANIRALSIFFR
jgi:hypothetical protein